MRCGVLVLSDRAARYRRQVTADAQRGLTLAGRVASHQPDGMSVDTDSAERGFVPTPFIRDSGAHDPPPVGTAVSVVVLGRDTHDRMILSSRLRDLAGSTMTPVAANDSCDWCYSAATASSRAESERLGLVKEYVYACDACLATEAFRQRPPDGLEETASWPFLLPDSQEE